MIAANVSVSMRPHTVLQKNPPNATVSELKLTPGHLARQMLGDQIYINVPFPDQRGECPYTLIHFTVFHPEARLLNGLATENREWPTHPALVQPVISSVRQQLAA